MKSLIIFITLLSIPFTTSAQETEKHSHDSHLQILVSNYMDMKNALVADNLDSAKASLALFANEVKGSKEMSDHSAHGEKHANHHGAMVKAVDKATEAANLEELRTAFVEISTNLQMALENQGFDTKVFVQFCPIFKGGSKWLSLDEKIQNPFFGQSMTTCGSVDKTLDVRQ